MSLMPLSIAVISASPWIDETHTGFLRELLAALGNPGDTVRTVVAEALFSHSVEIERYPLPASSTALGWDALGKKLSELQGRSAASWQHDVTNLLFKEPLHEFFSERYGLEIVR